MKENDYHLIQQIAARLGKDFTEYEQVWNFFTNLGIEFSEYLVDELEDDILREDYETLGISYILIAHNDKPYSQLGTVFEFDGRGNYVSMRTYDTGGS